MPNPELIPFKSIHFLNSECILVSQGRYTEGSAEAFGLLVAADLEPMTDITKNPAGHGVPCGHILVKSYSENEGLVELMAAAGWVEIVRKVSACYAELHVCRLLPGWDEALKHGLTRIRELEQQRKADCLKAKGITL